MKKKIMSSLLCLTVIASLFTGCKSADGNNTESPVKTTSDSTAVDEIEDGKSNETSTFKILGPDNGNLYFKFSEREEYPVWQEFRKLWEKKGIKLETEVIPNDQYLTVVQTRLASATDLPDMIQFSGLDDATALNMVSQGMLLPINEIVDQHSDGTAKAFFESGKGQYSNRLNTTEDGNVYWFSEVGATTYGGNPASTTYGISVRKDWLDRLNMALPTTIEEFYEMLVAFRKNDMNGNGVEDEVLAYDAATFGSGGIASWFGLVGDLSSFIIEEGVVTSPWYQPGIQEYFTYMNRLANENLLDTSLLGNTTGDQRDQRIAENKAGAVCTYAMQTWFEPTTGDPDALYVPLVPLKGTELAEPVLLIEPPFYSAGRWGITKACKDLETAAKMLDLICSEEYETLTQWGIEGDTYEVVDGKKQHLDIALNANWEQGAKERKVIGDFLWANNTLFPKRRFVPMENEMNVVNDEKAEYQRNIFSYHPTTPFGTSSYYPIMSMDQVERRQDIIVDLKARSTELSAQLILGQVSLDNWNSYIEEFKALGLDELIAINQSLLDRYNSYE